jgi:hypothetical protein
MLQTVFDRSNREIAARIARQRDAGHIRPRMAGVQWINRAEFAEAVRRLPVVHRADRRDWLEGLRLYDLLTCGEVPPMTAAIWQLPCDGPDTCPLRPAADWAQRAQIQPDCHRLLRLQDFLAVDARNSLVAPVQDILAATFAD